MRKNILIIVSILLLAALICLMIFGLKIGKFEIAKYSSIGLKSEEVKKLTSVYEVKNSKELPEKQDKIEKQITDYKKEKENYEALVEEKKNELYTTQLANTYEVDFLWTKIGNYATKNGLTLKFNITKSASDAAKPEYVLCDLSINVSGEYDRIANFVKNLEEDPKLEFEIRNFKMQIVEKQESQQSETGKVSTAKVNKLTANFVVEEIALLQETLSGLEVNKTTIFDGSTAQGTNTTNNTATSSTANTNSVKTTNATSTNTATNVATKK